MVLALPPPINIPLVIPPTPPPPDLALDKFPKLLEFPNVEIFKKSMLAVSAASSPPKN